MELRKSKRLNMNKRANIILSLIVVITLLSCNNSSKNGNIDDKNENETTQLVQETDSALIADSIKEDTVKLVQYSKEDVDKYVDSVNRLKEKRIYRRENIISERNIWGKDEMSARFVCYCFDSLNNYISVDYSEGMIYLDVNYMAGRTLYKFDNNGNCYYSLPPECSYIGVEYIKDNQVIFSSLREGEAGEIWEDCYNTYEFKPPFDFNIYKEQVLRNYQFAFIDSKKRLCFYESNNKSIIISKEKYPVTDIYFDDYYSRGKGAVKDLYYNIIKDNELYYRILDLNIHSDVTNTFMTRILNYDVFDKDKNSIEQVKDNYQNSVMNELTCLKGDISKMSYEKKKTLDENI